MRFKKLIISILIIGLVLSISSISYAKYVFEITKKAAEITINN